MNWNDLEYNANTKHVRRTSYLELYPFGTLVLTEYDDNQWFVAMSTSESLGSFTSRDRSLAKSWALQVVMGYVERLTSSLAEAGDKVDLIDEKAAPHPDMLKRIKRSRTLRTIVKDELVGV